MCRTRRILGQIRSRAVALTGPAVLIANGLALAGWILRDRHPALVLLFHLPAFPLGLAAIALGLARRGRAAPGRARLALAAVGVASVAVSAPALIGAGPGSVPAGLSPADVVRVLHWNVLWGGRPAGDASWAAIEDAILRRRPDVVVLSEAPMAPGRLRSLAARLGPGWSLASAEHAPGASYWFHLAVLARWAVRTGPPVPVRNGAAMRVTVERPGRPLRILVVDGQSRVGRSRTPLLADVAAACRRAEQAGTPFDLVAGDFNAPARSFGFDALRAAGYTPAAGFARGWRGTWPVPLPVYDIDHAWVRAPGRVLACALFAAPPCDHRGQLVELSVPRGP